MGFLVGSKHKTLTNTVGTQIFGFSIKHKYPKLGTKKEKNASVSNRLLNDKKQKTLIS
jgi:hypothetical protein